MKPIDMDPRAKAEYQAAVAWYEEQRAGLGVELILEVDKAFETIQESPERFPIIARNDVRQYMLKRFPYSVVYASLEDRIWVAAVAHHKRDPDYWQRRKPD